ncbi:MAG: hypothetical protein WBB28_07285 [Crinalium sp.]
MVASTTKNGTAKSEKADTEAEAKAARIAAKKAQQAKAAAKAQAESDESDDDETDEAEAEAAKPAAKTKKAKAEAKAETADTDDVSVEAKAFAQQIRSVVYKQFKVALPTREQQQLKSLAYGAKDKLGRAIARMVAKKNGTMNWKLWNEKVFPFLFGELGQTEVKLKHSAEVIALAISHLFDGISQEAEQAIADLIAYNQESFNSRQKPEKEDEELEDIDLDDLDDDDDELPSDDDDELEDDE